MKLGLLVKHGKERMTLRKQPVYVSFQHKSIQEFSAAAFLSTELQNSLTTVQVYQRKTLCLSYARVC